MGKNIIIFSIVLLCSILFVGIGVAEGTPTPQNVQVVYTVGSAYEVNIPPSISVTNRQSISITKMVLAPGQSIFISVNGGLHIDCDGEPGSRKMVLYGYDNSDDEEHHLDYKLTYISSDVGVAVQTDIPINNKIRIADSSQEIDPNDPYEVELFATVTENAHMHSGSYSDTVTVTVSIDDTPTS